MAKHICKYCGTNTTSADRICPGCMEKLILIRNIKAMLMPYYKRKKEREKKNGSN